MLSSFRIFNIAEDCYLLNLHKSLEESAQSALKKYIVFSKAELSQEQQLVGIGLHGPKAKENLSKLFTDLFLHSTHPTLLH